LTPGSIYSAIATSNVGAAALVVKTSGDVASPSGQSLYTPLSAPLPGTWAYAPSLRKNAPGTQSTELTVLNSRATAQNYQIAYVDQNGDAAKSDQLCLNPSAAWSYSQASDGSLPDGYNGAAQIINVSFQVLPIAVADLYAGSFLPPAAPNASPACLPTAQPTVTSTVTATATTTTVPSSTATTTASPQPSPIHSVTPTASTTPNASKTPTAVSTATITSTPTKSTDGWHAFLPAINLGDSGGW
jgi:hypothetical protein